MYNYLTKGLFNMVQYKYLKVKISGSSLNLWKFQFKKILIVSGHCVVKDVTHK